jgi:hypothetical protein
VRWNCLATSHFECLYAAGFRGSFTAIIFELFQAAAMVDMSDHSVNEETRTMKKSFIFFRGAFICLLVIPISQIATIAGFSLRDRDAARVEAFQTAPRLAQKDALEAASVCYALYHL